MAKQKKSYVFVCLLHVCGPTSNVLHIWKNFSNERTHFSKLAEHTCWWRCLQKADETIALTSGSNNSFNTSSEPTNKKTGSKIHISRTRNMCYLQGEYFQASKHQKTRQQEIAAAKALYNKNTNTKFTLHFAQQAEVERVVNGLL